jgi:hypothetical protein
LVGWLKFQKWKGYLEGATNFEVRLGDGTIVATERRRADRDRREEIGR